MIFFKFLTQRVRTFSIIIMPDRSVERLTKEILREVTQLEVDATRLILIELTNSKEFLFVFEQLHINFYHIMNTHTIYIKVGLL